MPIGALKVALHDLREDSSTHGVTSELLLGEIYGAQVLKIPAGVAHGCAALVGPTHLFYVTSQRLRPAGRRPDPPRRPGHRLRLAGGPADQVAASSSSSRCRDIPASPGLSSSGRPLYQASVARIVSISGRKVSPAAIAFRQSML